MTNQNYITHYLKYRIYDNSILSNCEAQNIDPVSLALTENCRKIRCHIIHTKMYQKLFQLYSMQFSKLCQQYYNYSVNML